MNFAGVGEYAARAKRLHPSSPKLYVRAQSGYAATAASILWASLELEVRLLWIPAVLAVFWGYQAWAGRRVLTDRSECRQDPELPPKTKAMLKNA
ncbi:hypothetical protein GCM10028833_02780 [Glycomyces tarimensis]